MSDAFRTKVEPLNETEQYVPDVPVNPEPQPETAQGEAVAESTDYPQDYFGVKEIYKEDKIIKMQIGLVDKFIKQTLSKEGKEMNNDNWQETLDEIERTIGTTKLEVYERLRKISEYIKVIQKYNNIKELKESYDISRSTTESRL